MPAKKSKGGKKGKAAKGGGDGAGTEDLIEEMFYFPPEHERERKLRAQKRIKEAFGLFERDNNGTCDVREIGTIIRSLDLNPTENQLKDILEEIEEDEPTGYIKYSKFEPLMVDLLLTNEYKPKRKTDDGKDAPSELLVRSTEDHIMQAFEALDTDGRGYLDSEQVKELLTGQADPFTPEEVIEMLNAAADPETGFVKYDDYVGTLASD